MQLSSYHWLGGCTWSLSNSESNQCTNANLPIDPIYHPTTQISNYDHDDDIIDPAFGVFAGIIINIHTHTNTPIQPISDLINESIPHPIIAASVEAAIAPKPGPMIAWKKYQVLNQLLILLHIQFTPSNHE